MIMSSDDKSSPVRERISDPSPNEPESASCTLPVPMKNLNNSPPNEPGSPNGPAGGPGTSPLDHDDVEVDVVVLSPADTETIGACPICMCRCSSAVMRHCSSTFDLVFNSTNSATSGGCCRIPCSCTEGTYHVDCLAEHFRTTASWKCPICRQDLLLYENALRGEQMVTAVLASLGLLELPEDEEVLFNLGGGDVGSGGMEWIKKIYS